MHPDRNCSLPLAYLRPAHRPHAIGAPQLGRRAAPGNKAPLAALLLSAWLVSACGGGGGTSSVAADATTQPGSGQPAVTGSGANAPGGASTPSTGDPATSTISGPPGAPATIDGAAMEMRCEDGPGVQCSGTTPLRTDNGIVLTASGVQAYGRSTSDLMTPNPTMTSAFGLAPASGGWAEIRLTKDASGSASSPALILRNLGLTWDGRNERPPIIETFRTSAGRIQLDANGRIASLPLPPSADLDFYDFARRGPASATQANYANNVYFPRADNPARCPDDLNPCPAIETTGLRAVAGDWRSGGTTPDAANAVRVHEDGDVHAGDGIPDASGQRTILPGGDGPGVPFPGSKGYRSFDNLGYRYSNLSLWLTQDTVVFQEWAGLGNEHNKNRRGVVAFGDVTPPADVPASGNASYAGLVEGWYSSNGSTDPVVFRGVASVSVNFATREATVVLRDAASSDGTGTIPINFSGRTLLGWAGTNTANYFMGAASNGRLRGGISGRLFGTASAVPAEVAGIVSLADPLTGATVLAGFLTRRQ